MDQGPSANGMEALLGEGGQPTLEFVFVQCKQKTLVWHVLWSFKNEPDEGRIYLQ